MHMDLSLLILEYIVAVIIIVTLKNAIIMYFTVNTFLQEI